MKLTIVNLSCFFFLFVFFNWNTAYAQKRASNLGHSSSANKVNTSRHTNKSKLAVLHQLNSGAYSLIYAEDILPKSETTAISRGLKLGRKDLIFTSEKVSKFNEDITAIISKDRKLAGIVVPTKYKNKMVASLKFGPLADRIAECGRDRIHCLLTCIKDWVLGI